MKQFQDLIRHIEKNGVIREDRTGVGTKGVFGYQMRFDLQEGFPILTTKRVPFGLVKSELMWFLRGDTNIRYLLEHKNHIWTEWAFEKYVKSPAYKGPDMTDFGRRAVKDPEFNTIYQEEVKAFEQRILEDEDFARIYGDLGHIYGYQWRSWPTRDGGKIDQIADLIDQIKKNPYSRRHLLTAWNPEEVPDMALPPCHTFCQFYVSEGRLSCQLYQRSADVFLGVPFNIASYALLTHLIARACGLEVGEFIHSFGDAHLYLNHKEAVEELMKREPKSLPKLVIDSDEEMEAIDLKDIRLEGYEPYPTIKAPIAV